MLGILTYGKSSYPIWITAQGAVVLVNNGLGGSIHDNNGMTYRRLFHVCATLLSLVTIPHMGKMGEYTASVDMVHIVAALSSVTAAPQSQTIFCLKDYDLRI